MAVESRWIASHAVAVPFLVSTHPSVYYVTTGCAAKAIHQITTLLNQGLFNQLLIQLF